MRAIRLLLPICVAILLASTALPVLAGTISGRVFTADHPDSVASGVPVMLIFRGSDGEMSRQTMQSDAAGHFHFLDLSQDTAMVYILQITYRGKDFLSGGIRFEPGQDEVDYSVLLTTKAPDQSGLPSGHPSLPGQRPPQGRPVSPNILHTVLIVLWIALIFVLLGFMARSRKSGEKTQDSPPAVRALIRDIASLDIRHDDGVIGEEEYRKVREGLMARLRSLTRRASG
jgi:hypothetical protein